MLMLKKQCIAIIHCKQKLSLFSRDDIRQAKSLIFIVIPETEQVPKVKKTKRDFIRTLLFWNRIIVMIITVMNFFNV